MTDLLSVTTCKYDTRYHQYFKKLDPNCLYIFEFIALTQGKVPKS